MSEETSFLFAEYAHPVAARGANRRKRILLVLLYILFGTAYAAISFSISIPHLVAVLPLFVWMLVFFTWRHVSYECCVRVMSGEIQFLRLYGKKERLLLSLPIKALSSVKTATGDERATNDFRSGAGEQSVYFATGRTEEKDVSLLFDGSDAVIKLLRYYNKSAFSE